MAKGKSVTVGYMTSSVTFGHGKGRKKKVIHRLTPSSVGRLARIVSKVPRSKRRVLKNASTRFSVR